MADEGGGIRGDAGARPRISSDATDVTRERAGSASPDMPAMDTDASEYAASGRPPPSTPPGGSPLGRGGRSPGEVSIRTADVRLSPSSTLGTPGRKVEVERAAVILPREFGSFGDVLAYTKKTLAAFEGGRPSADVIHDFAINMGMVDFHLGKEAARIEEEGDSEPGRMRRAFGAKSDGKKLEEAQANLVELQRRMQAVSMADASSKILGLQRNNAYEDTLYNFYSNNPELFDAYNELLDFVASGRVATDKDLGRLRAWSDIIQVIATHFSSGGADEVRPILDHQLTAIRKARPLRQVDDVANAVERLMPGHSLNAEYRAVLFKAFRAHSPEMGGPHIADTFDRLLNEIGSAVAERDFSHTRLTKVQTAAIQIQLAVAELASSGQITEDESKLLKQQIPNALMDLVGFAQHQFFADDIELLASQKFNRPMPQDRNFRHVGEVRTYLALINGERSPVALRALVSPEEALRFSLHDRITDEVGHEICDEYVIPQDLSRFRREAAATRRALESAGLPPIMPAVHGYDLTLGKRFGDVWREVPRFEVGDPERTTFERTFIMQHGNRLSVQRYNLDIHAMNLTTDAQKQAAVALHFDLVNTMPMGAHTPDEVREIMADKFDSLMSTAEWSRKFRPDQIASMRGPSIDAAVEAIGTLEDAREEVYGYKPGAIDLTPYMEEEGDALGGGAAVAHDPDDKGSAELAAAAGVFTDSEGDSSDEEGDW